MSMLSGGAAKVKVIGGDAKGRGCRPTLNVSNDEQGYIGGYLFSVSAGASLTLQGFDMVLGQKSGAVYAETAGPLSLVWVSVYQGFVQDPGGGSVTIRETPATITGGRFEDNGAPSSSSTINVYSASGPASSDLGSIKGIPLTITGATFTNNQVGRRDDGRVHMTGMCCIIAHRCSVYD